MTIDELFRRNLVWRRKRRGWSQAELSRRVTGLGHKIGVDAMSKIEKGDRRVTLADAVALAAALDVPLPALLLGSVEEELSPAPALSLRMPFAAAWLSGEMPLARENLGTYQQAFGGPARMGTWLAPLLLHKPNAHEIEMARAYVEIQRQRANEVEELASRSDIPSVLATDLRVLAEENRAKAIDIEKLLPKEEK